MIHIKSSHTLIDIIEEIESEKGNDIILDFPLGHPVLHNYISLKLLKSKTHNKNLVIISNDHIGKKIGKQLGIKYSSIKHQKFIKKGSEDSLMKHNFGFWEFFVFQIQSYFQELRANISSNQKFYAFRKYSHLYQEKYSLRLFFVALSACIGLFLFIYYFAVSKTYVSITPETVIKKEASNFTFMENTENDILQRNRIIRIEYIDKKIFSSENYTSTEISENNSSLAEGTVRIYNEYPSPQELVQNTRLQDSSDRVFTIIETVTIPPALTDNFGNISPGIIDIKARARSKSANGEYIGAKGNIQEGVRFIIPGLDEEGQKFIYAESIEAFTGGNDNFTKIVSQEDIDTAKELFTEKMRTQALKSLKDEIEDRNRNNDSGLEILSGGRSIRYGEPQLRIDANIEAGMEIESFNISGSIDIGAYVYNKKTIIQRLRTLINEKQLEGIEKISYIDPNTLRQSQVLYIRDREGEDFELKATFEIEALLLHDFLHTENNYIQYLRAQILGKNKNDAEKILLNDPKISNAEISIRPFFSQSVSRIPANVIFEVK